MIVKYADLFRRFSVKFLFIQLGALLTAFALKNLLLMNSIIDGGVVGVSMIVSVLTHLPLGILVIGLNVPFLLLGFKVLGRTFMISALYAILSLSIWLAFLPVQSMTKDLFLVSIFGGLLLGSGVGLIIRHGGCLDGIEVIGILLNKRLPFSVGEIYLFFNSFIFLAAGFLFGLDKGLYSAVTFFIAYKAIDLVVEGIDESKSIFIVSIKTEEISQAVMRRLNNGVTILRGMGGYSKQEKDIIYVIVRRLEVSKIKDLVREIDASAFITIQNVHEVIANKTSGTSVL